MTTLAIIPARAGSKRVPQKNTRLCAGKPLLAWTIDCANQSKLLDAILVSTESPDIKAIAESYGVEVPFLRPEALAQDDSRSEDVMAHVLSEWQKTLTLPEVIVLLQPTSPLRKPQDIDDALALLTSSGADSVETVTQDPSHPWLRFEKREGALLRVTELEGLKGKALYQPTGSVFAVRTTSFLRTGNIRGLRHVGLERSREVSLDVDTEEDFCFADMRLQDRTAK